MEAGLRQLRRSRPLEVERLVADDQELPVPTLPEMLCIKAYLVVQRNQVRDYLETVALSERLGADAVDVLLSIDEYYRDRSNRPDSVLTSLVQRLSKPAPRDRRVISQLRSHKGIDERWSRWDAVVAACTDLADELLDRLRPQDPRS